MPAKSRAGLKTLVLLLWLAVILAAVGVAALLVSQGVIDLGGAAPAGGTPAGPSLSSPTLPPSIPTLTPLQPAPDTATLPPTAAPEGSATPSLTPVPPSPTASLTPFAPRQALILALSTDGCRVQSIDPATGATAPLTAQAPASVCYQPQLSPDGSRLAFLMPGTNSTLYDMNADGSGLKRLSLGHIYAFDWSADGSRLVYASLLPDQGVVGLVFINADGSGRAYSSYTGLALTPGDIHVAWSPDGQWVYAPVDDPTGADQSLPYALNADGSSSVQLSSRAVDPTARIAWSPDSRSVSFLIGGYDYGYSVTLLDFLGLDGAPIPSLYYDDPSVQGATLAPEGKFTAPPFWSADGGRAALAGVSSLVAGEYQLLSMDAATRSLQLVADLDRRADLAAWSPSGDRLAFLTLGVSGDTASLNVVNPDGSGLQTLPGDFAAAAPVWVLK